MADQAGPSPARPGRVAALLGLMIAAAAMAGAALASGSDWLAVELPDEPGQGAALWQIAVPGQSEPRSLVSAGDGANSCHLALTLSGVHAWNRQTAPAGQRRWTSSDGQWQLDLQLTPGESAYRSLLEVTLGARESNTEAHHLSLQIGPGIGELPRPELGIATSLYSYTRPSVFHAGGVRTPEEEDAPFVLVEGDWAGLHSRYFALLLSPLSFTSPQEVAFGQAEPGDESLTGYLPWMQLELDVPPLAAGQRQSWQFEVFSGPKTRVALAADHDGQGDYSKLLFDGLWGWMRGLSLGLLWVLEALHGLVSSWGVAIIVLAVLVRLLLYPLGRWALSSQQRFSEVQAEIAPEIRDIKRSYKGGEQSERILQLYEQRGVSPLAGLKPLLIVLIQIPIFVALFHVLGQVFEFRDASFLWIESLAEPDRLFTFGRSLPFFGAWFNLLPVLMALTTLASIRLSPAPAASPAERRRQNIFLWLLAVAFFLLFYPFPSGMVLYWIMANALYILQFQLTRRGFRSAQGGPA